MTLTPLQREALGNLAILRDAGQITDAEFDEVGQALGVLEASHHGKEGP